MTPPEFMGQNICGGCEGAGTALDGSTCGFCGGTGKQRPDDPPGVDGESDRAWAARFRAAASKAEQRGPREGVDPRIHQAMIDAYRSKADDLDPDRRRDGLPKVVGLCPDLTHAREFYMPHGGTCPWCDNELVIYTADADATTGERKPHG